MSPPLSHLPIDQSQVQVKRPVLHSETPLLNESCCFWRGGLHRQTVVEGGGAPPPAAAHLLELNVAAKPAKMASLLQLSEGVKGGCPEAALPCPAIQTACLQRCWRH